MQRGQYRDENYGEYGEFRAYLLAMAEDNSQELNRVKRNLRIALKEEITDRQRTMLLMYYVQQMNMTEIAEDLCVNVSTVSRTLKRAKLKLRRCLRYGAKELLSSSIETK